MEVDKFHTHKLKRCPDCGRRVKRAKRPPRVVQQMELVEKPVMIHEHKALAYECKKCERVRYAPMPSDVEKGGVAGPRLTAVIAYLEGACHASFSTIQGCLRDCLKDFDVLVQFCLAHLIREVKFLAEHPGAAAEAYGKRLLSALRGMFGVIHRRGEMTPGVEPTNNLAEQAIRFVVIDRRVTQGTRGEKGRRWCERIWTVVATCARQGRSAYEFILAAVRAHFAGEQAPSLLPIPP